MGDLEEFIFKQNVPGRYSTWTEEQDDVRREHGHRHDYDVQGASEEYDGFDPNHEEFRYPTLPNNPDLPTIGDPPLSFLSHSLSLFLSFSLPVSVCLLK
jgi:hypothetical protein